MTSFYMIVSRMQVFRCSAYIAINIPLRDLHKLNRVKDGGSKAFRFKWNIS